MGCRAVVDRGQDIGIRETIVPATISSSTLELLLRSHLSHVPPPPGSAASKRLFSVGKIYYSDIISGPWPTVYRTESPKVADDWVP